MIRIFDSLAGTIDTGTTSVSDDDIAVISNLSNPPPVPVKIKDIYVRKCRLAGDGINCHFGRFHTEDLPDLLNKTQGASCLIGHRKETAGIARFFGGSIESHPALNIETGKIEKMNFIVPKIYWMKSHSQAEDLRLNIDGGIYHQASISWYFEKPVCGICKKDIRLCDHVPGKRYDGKLCFFWYEDIGDVLEGSIVFAGGHPGTGFELNNNVKADYESQASLFKLNPERRIHKEDILPYFQNIQSGNLYITGDMAKHGWTDGLIDILPDKNAFEHLGEILPGYLADRINVCESVLNSAPCIKVNHNSVLEIEFLPPIQKKGGHEDTGKDRKIHNRDTIKKDNRCGINFSVYYDAGEELNRAPEKIFDTSQMECKDEHLVVMPQYNAVPVKISIGSQKKKNENTAGEINNIDSISFILPQGYAKMEKIFLDFFADVARELKIMNLYSCEILAGLIAFKGKSRVELSIDSSGKNVFPEKPRFSLKVMDFSDETTKNSEFLIERLEHFSEICKDSRVIQCIPFGVSLGDDKLYDKIESVSTHEGVLLMPLASRFGDSSRKVFLSKKLVLDVSVISSTAKSNGWIHGAGIKDHTGLKYVGATHLTPIKCRDGDTILVEVDSVSHLDNKISWKNPRVVGVRIDKKPDSIETFKLMDSFLNKQSARIASQRQIKNGETGIESSKGQKSFLSDSESNDRQPFAKIRIRIKDENNCAETFYMKADDVEKLNRGYLCPGFWQSDVDSESSAYDIEFDSVKNLNDIDSVTILEWGENNRVGAFTGDSLHGIYQFRLFIGDNKPNWYIVKKII